MQKKDVSVTFCNFSSEYVTSASKLFIFSNETHYIYIYPCSIDLKDS